ncbi:hypothetical protein FA15DRAFT_697327 [Coprinopsis marcescibilis]|uniref:Ricin B lectin domain-containing protein n=1 Tax=Coprinopsis marcescibilis TaxID=230819 RepID=A0A5C3KHW9_COPMA|nr:hypothetical protein FA15DRAFT_697327 [Coprinopsis marcescibilis]
MSFPTGHYFIRSVTQSPDNAIGRYVAEDRSLNPKQIVNGVVESEVQEEWIIENAGPSGYALRNAGARVGALEGKLFAFLIDDPRQFWRIVPFGDKSYRILNASDETSGWVFKQGELEQVEVKKLDQSGGEKELWVITSAER